MTETYETGDQVTINEGAVCAFTDAIDGAPRVERAELWADGSPWEVQSGRYGSLRLQSNVFCHNLTVRADDVTRYAPDPYAHLRAAWAKDGKDCGMWFKHCGKKWQKWDDSTEPHYSRPPEDYHIGPPEGYEPPAPKRDELKHEALSDMVDVMRSEANHMDIAAMTLRTQATRIEGLIESQVTA